jgi:hypothetical protein
MAVAAARTVEAVDSTAAEEAVDSMAVAEARTAVAAEPIAAAQVALIVAAAGAWVRRLRDVLAAVRLAAVSATAQAGQRVLMPRLTASGIHSAARDLELDRQREAAVALATPQAQREAREVPRTPMAHGIRLVARAALARQAEHRGRSDDREQVRETRRARIRLALIHSARLHTGLVRARDRVEWGTRRACRIEARQLQLRWAHISTARLLSATRHFRMRGMAAGSATDMAGTVGAAADTVGADTVGAADAGAAALDGASAGDLVLAGV